jgi:ATP synthase protein I
MKKEDGDRATHSWLRYSNLGMQFAVTLVLFLLAGMWADRRFGTDPWLTVAGSLVGIGGGMYLLIKQTGLIR